MPNAPYQRLAGITAGRDKLLAPPKSTFIRG